MRVCLVARRRCGVVTKRTEIRPAMLQRCPKIPEMLCSVFAIGRFKEDLMEVVLEGKVFQGNCRWREPLAELNLQRVLKYI